MGCFDNLNHDYIMNQIKEFPYADLIGKWLKAGYVDNGVFNETESGSGQGNIVSPLLANIALMGMEDILGIKYKPVKGNGGIVSYANETKYKLVFYADDFVVMCNTQKDAEDVYGLLKPYLEKRGLELSKEKTRVVTIEEGFNFLGFNVRLYRTCQGEKLLIKPAKESIKKSKETISKEIQKLKGNNVSAVIDKLNPIIRGIGNYWSSSVAKQIYSYGPPCLGMHFHIFKIPTSNEKQDLDNKQVLQTRYSGTKQQPMDTDRPERTQATY